MSRLNTLPSDQWIAEEKWFVINVSGISIFYIITPSTEALVLFSLHFMSPKCPIRFNVSLLKWINLAKLPGWCEYLCALCLSDGARLPFFFPSSMEMCWYFQLRGKCIQITYFTAAGELVDFYDTRLPPGAICKSDAAGSIQIKIALFLPGGEIHFFTQSVINCTHTHTHSEYSTAPHIHSVLTRPRGTWTRHRLVSWSMADELNPERTSGLSQPLVSTLCLHF